MSRTRTILYTWPGDGPASVEIRDEHVSNYAPSMVTPYHSVINMMDGRTHRVAIPFSDFHKWMVAPTAAAVDAVAEEASATPKSELDGRTKRSIRKKR
jgi:hypothetical protein